jgi:cysteine-rich repeat protein
VKFLFIAGVLIGLLFLAGCSSEDKPATDDELFGSGQDVTGAVAGQGDPYGCSDNKQPICECVEDTSTGLIYFNTMSKKAKTCTVPNTRPTAECRDGDTITDYSCTSKTSLRRCYNDCDANYECQENGNFASCVYIGSGSPGSNPSACGDGTCNSPSGEDCNTCAADCGNCPVPGSCPNGVCDLGENANSCPNDCKPVCGNSAVETGEECDDGNTLRNDGCSDKCKLEVCGDGICSTSETKATCGLDCNSCYESNGQGKLGDSCSSTADCGPKLYCNGLSGKCQSSQCNSEPDCTGIDPTTYCNNCSVCASYPCQTRADCKPDVNGDQPYCENGYCVDGCHSNADCSLTKNVCNTDTGKCQACNLDPKFQCDSDYFCAELSGQCRLLQGSGTQQ